MKSQKNKMLVALFGLSMLGLSGAATASVSWTFSGNCDSAVGGSCGSGSWSDTRTYAGNEAGTGSVTVSGWGNTLGAANLQLEQGEITQWNGNGLGVRNADWNTNVGSKDLNEGGTPEHAIDSNGRYDLVLFDFGKKVQVTGLEVGYYNFDADLNLLAYTGSGTPNIAGLEFGATETLRANGWSLSTEDQVAGADDDLLVGYDLAPAGYDKVLEVNTKHQLESRYWIVSAHNPVFGNLCYRDPNECEANVSFKLQKVVGTYSPPDTQVPVPATLALLMAGFAGFGYRRQSKAAV